MSEKAQELVEQELKEAANSVVRIAIAVGEAIKEVSPVPEGVLYAGLMGKLNLRSFQYILDLLVEAGKITIQGHVITWKE